MSKTDKSTVRNMILHVSFNDAERMYFNGMISQRVYDLYRSIWRNNGHRISNVAIHYDRPHWVTLARAAIDEAKMLEAR